MICMTAILFNLTILIVWLSLLLGVPVLGELTLRVLDRRRRLSRWVERLSNK